VKKGEKSDQDSSGKKRKAKYNNTGVVAWGLLFNSKSADKKVEGGAGEGEVESPPERFGKFVGRGPKKDSVRENGFTKRKKEITNLEIGGKGTRSEASRKQNEPGGGEKKKKKEARQTIQPALC